MAVGSLQLVVSLLALSSALAVAYDPSILQDFCVAENSDAVFVNGLACKNPSLATIDDFTYSGLNFPRNTDNKIGANLTVIDTTVIPGMNTLGISLVRIDLAADGGLNPPHEHPRTLYVGFVTSNPDNRLISKVLYPGDVFVFPIGLIHFQFNVDKAPAVAFAGLSSQNPGVITIANAVFGSNPPVNADVLTKAFQLDKDIVADLQKKFAKN
ncbi:Germin-like protein subfamily 1 member 13 [Linum perenne]